MSFKRHFALGPFVAAFDDDDRRGALVGIFELRPHAALPEIELGANAAGAQLADHGLIARKLIAIEHQHDDRPDMRLVAASSPRISSAAASRDTPIDTPVAGTFLPRKRSTRLS